MVIRSIAVLVLTLLAMWGARARAQSPVGQEDAPDTARSERARALFSTGVEKAQAEQWSSAEQDFRASYDLVPRPSTLYNLALVAFKLRHFRESLELCTRLLATADPTTESTYRAHAEALISRARKEISTVDVILTPGHASWNVDGQSIDSDGTQRQIVLEPGVHAFEFSAPGHESRHIDLVVAAGDRHTLTVELSSVDLPVPTTAAAAPSPTPSQVALERRRMTQADPLVTHGNGKTPRWLLLGTGGALLAAGAVTGLMALSADAEFKQKCPELRDCDASLASLQDRTQTLSTATDVLLIAGGVAAGSALVWFVLAAHPDATSARVRASAVASRSGLGLRIHAAF